MPTTANWKTPGTRFSTSEYQTVAMRALYECRRDRQEASRDFDQTQMRGMSIFNFCGGAFDNHRDAEWR